MKIAIITAIWKRPEIFKLFTEGIRQITKAHPTVKFEVVVAGSEGKNSESIVKEAGFHYIEIPNQPLAEKHNSTLKKVKTLSPDYIICLGSDDILSPELVGLYIEKLQTQKLDIIGLKDFYFYDVRNGKAIYWAGYNDGRKGLFCGAGVILSAKVLNVWGWKIWNNAHNAVLDNSLHEKIRMTPCKKLTICLRDEKMYAVDLKSDTNMTPFERWPNSIEIPKEEIRQQFNYLPMGNDISDFAYVSPNVIMGDGNVVMEGAIIRDGVVMGDNNFVGAYCIIGDAPEKTEWFDKSAGVTIGNNNRFTKQVTIDSGTERKTYIGDNNLFLKNSHIGHDADISNDNVFSCNSVIGGWTRVKGNCNFGLGAVVHQRLTIPEKCMIGMGGVVTKKSDLNAGRKYAGVPVKDIGSNVRD